MNLRKFLLVLPIALTILHLQGFAQRDRVSLNTIILKTAKLGNDHPTEKVYLHFDKPYYAVGDTIWFKAYLMIDQHLPSPLSKICAVDILNSRDSLMQFLKVQVKNSVAWSFIPISQYGYKKGNYRVVAYTNW